MGMQEHRGLSIDSETTELGTHWGYDDLYYNDCVARADTGVYFCDSQKFFVAKVIWYIDYIVGNKWMYT